MSIFKRRKKSFTVTEKDPTYKVRYLGNVATSMTKGDGCVDKPVAILWNNYLKTSAQGIDMKLTACSSGLKVETKEQGLTEYRAHRITYCIAHPEYPKVFVWVYKHEGKRMKVEQRCHAVLCKADPVAKAIAVQLHERLHCALMEFKREKNRRQNSRLALQRTNSLPGSSTNSSGVSGVPVRKMFLVTSQNFKPSIEKSSSAPKLHAISEDMEGEVLEGLDEEEEEEEDIDEDALIQQQEGSPTGFIPGQRSHSLDSGSSGEDLSDPMLDLEIGNNIDELRRDSDVRKALQRRDSDEDSSESGFSEQDAREGSTGSASGSPNQESKETTSNGKDSGPLPEVSHNTRGDSEKECNGDTETADTSPKKPIQTGQANGNIPNTT